MKTRSFRLEDPDDFREKALHWAAKAGNCCCFDSNTYADPYSAFDFLLAAGVKREVRATTAAFTALQEFLSESASWSFGFLTYDLKNELEDLDSAHADRLHFPNLYFFEPEHLLQIRGDELRLTSADPEQVFDAVGMLQLPEPVFPGNLEIRQRTSRAEYLAAVARIREHIRRGDIYELNFCQEFFAEADLDPETVFRELSRVSPAPFAVFFREGDRYLISATPERFLGKRGNKLITQPIKGTAKRAADPAEDRRAAQELKENEKERAENVMIVDLVRNDLTRCAVPGSVRVEELFGIYSFSQVHQMISTVVCEVPASASLTDLIRPLFPMGSMTGAPKLRAMQLIEEYEKTRRGLFSGAAGYFSPAGDFDFNVVIRSILYNAADRYVSFQAGSAITFDSDPEKEYEECLLKIAGILDVLRGGSRKDAKPEQGYESAS